MKLTFDDKYEFIPKWNGNETDSEPVKILCRYLSSPERSRCIKKEILADNDKSTVKIVYHEVDLFTLSVEKIENLEVNGKKVKTAAEFLAEENLSSLFDEIVNEIVRRNTRSNLKNS